MSACSQPSQFLSLYLSSLCISSQEENQYLTTANLICNANTHAKHSCGRVYGLQAEWCEVAELGAQQRQV